MLKTVDRQTLSQSCIEFLQWRGRRGHARMVVGFITTYSIRISVYHHQRCFFESRSWRGLLDITKCINKTNNHLSPPIIEHKKTGPWFKTLENQVLERRRRKSVVKLNQLMGFQPSPFTAI